MLDAACTQLAPALSARIVRWRTVADTADAGVDGMPRTGAITTVEIPVTEPPHYALEIGGLVGGRRLLSGDRAALDAIASHLGRRIDAIRLADERYQRERREQEIGALATEAELRALRAQINPHFLFNALTTIGYLIQTAPGRALDTLMRLTALLRSVLRSEGEFTTLGRELELVEAYLDIEHARFEQRLQVRIDVPQALRSLRVPPLLLQPVVENAVKHGISPLRHGGDVTVAARLETAGGSRALVLTVHDTGAGATDTELRLGRDVGVGLTNIERRLAFQYGNAAALSIRSAPGAGTTVEIRLPAEDKAAELAAARSES
jgi:two-component system LytT family sensor kinase